MNQADTMLQNITLESIEDGSWETLITPVDDVEYNLYASRGDTTNQGEGHVWAALTALLAIRGGNMVGAYAGCDLFAELNDYLRTDSQQARVLAQAVYAAMGEQNQHHPILYRGYRFSNSDQQAQFIEQLMGGCLVGLLSCSEDVNVAIGFAPNKYSVVLTIDNPPATVPVETATGYDAECEQLALCLEFEVASITYHPSGLITARITCK